MPVPAHFAQVGVEKGEPSTDGAKAGKVEPFLLPAPAHLDRWRTSQQAGRQLQVVLLPALPGLVSSPPDLFCFVLFFPFLFFAQPVETLRVG